MKMLKKSAVPAILAVALIAMVAAVDAAAYVQLQWTITATVSANPSVCFVDWTDGTTKANTFDYAVNIFPSITTIDENITYGLWNSAAAQKTAYIRIQNLTTTSNIDSLNVTIYNGTTISTNLWSSFGTLPTAWSSSFTCGSESKYAIWVEIATDAAATGSSTFTVEIKELAP